MENNRLPMQPQRTKEPSERQMRNLKTNLQTLDISPAHQVYYNLASKQSKSGFFSNDRLLILNTKQKSLGYVSKLPEGLIPLLNQEQVNSLKFKQKITRNEIVNGDVKSFRCCQMPGKVSTIDVFFKKGNSSEPEHWFMTMGNVKLMNDWIELTCNTLLKQEEPPKVPEIVKEPSPPPEVEKPIVESKKVLNQNMMVSPQNTSYFNPSQDRPPYVAQPANSEMGQNSKISQNESQIPHSRLANMPQYQYINELKYLQKEKPELFNNTNELSNKNLLAGQEERQVENSNALNTYPQPKLNTIPMSERINEETYPYQNKSRQKLERSAVNTNINSAQYQDPYFDKKKGESRSALVNPSAGNEYEKYMPRNSRPLQQSPPLEESNEYKKYQFIGDPEPQININSAVVDQQSRGKQYQPYQRVNKNSREQLETYQEPYKSQSKKSIPISNKNSKRELTNFKKESPANSQLRLNEQKNSQIRLDAPLAKSNYLSKDSQAASGHGFSSRGLSRKKWNEVFAESSNKLEIYEEFIHSSFNIVRDIINQLPLDSDRKEYLPIEAKAPFFTYYNEGIIITLHCFQQAKNLNTNHPYAPILYDHSTYQVLKREFYNYNLVLSVTANQGFIKVPLCSYFQYKGILALCKAEMPESFSEVTPKRYQSQFEIIQNQIHLRFMFGSFNAYLQPNQKYILLDNMKELIPEIPLVNKQTYFFRKQFLLSYESIIQDNNNCIEAHEVLSKKIVSEFLGKLQSVETYIVNYNDLKRIFHEEGLSLAFLPLLVQQTKSPFFKKLFMTEIVSLIFSSIFRSEINNLLTALPKEQQLTLQSTNAMLIDSCHTLFDLLFSYSNNSEALWKSIVEQSRQKYRIIISKEDLIPGYLLSSIIERMGIDCNFRRSSFNKHEIDFFAKSDNLPRDLFIGFRMKIRRYDLTSLSAQIQNIHSILDSEPTPDNFRILVSSLNLKQEPLPNYLYYLEQSILTYLCNFVPYSEHQQFQHIGIYNMVLLEPHSYYSTKCSLLAIKWCVKKKLIDEALKIYEMKEVENAFWQGQYNPAISQFYDFFAMYHASIGQYDQATQLARLSLKNTMQVAGPMELPVADKHYQLGNIFFKMGKKEESLRQYSKTKQILMLHQQTQISQYAVILLKLAILFLNFGKIAEAVNHSLQALKIFDNTQSSEQDQIGTFEILSRCYEITKRQKELQNICDLAAQKFNNTEDCLIFQRMIKLALYVKLKKLGSPQAKAFLAIISKLQQQAQDYSQMQAFSFLNRKTQSEILLTKLQHYLQNIVYLYEEASKKDLFRRYKSLDGNTKTEVEQMLVIFEAIGNIIGFGYLIGSLKETFD